MIQNKHKNAGKQRWVGIDQLERKRIMQEVTRKSLERRDQAFAILQVVDSLKLKWKESIDKLPAEQQIEIIKNLFDI
jgi:hypothetical protein